MMKRLFSFFRSARFWQALVSLFFAIVLFFTAWSGNTLQARRDNNATNSETFTQTVESVPVDIKYDSDKYFISGYSYDAEVYLTATTQLALTTEASNDTRHFKLVADLTNLGEGTSRVPIQVKDLPAGMSAQVSPSTLTATIGKKATKKFEVQANIDSSKLAKGYQLKNATLDETEVEVTSSEDIINQIDHVEAVLPNDVTLSDDYDGDLTLQAVSSSGTVLASSISPSKVRGHVTISKLSKTVPITVNLTGTQADGVASINYEIDKSQASISGSQSDLDKISNLVANVDISDVTKNMTKTIDLSADGVTVTPKTLKVRLKVTQK